MSRQTLPRICVIGCGSSGMPLAEKQAKLIADPLCGRIHFPDMASMRKDMTAERAAMAKRYGRAPRHTMQADNEASHHTLDQIRKQGERRAKKAGYSLPVPARAELTQTREAA